MSCYGMDSTLRVQDAAFYLAFLGFQGKNGEMYQAATTSLSMVAQTQLMELMVVADRNATAGSSTSA